MQYWKRLEIEPSDWSTDQYATSRDLPDLVRIGPTTNYEHPRWATELAAVLDCLIPDDSRTPPRPPATAN